jgi:hypothetical protein
MKLMLWLCVSLGLIGCLQDVPIARRGPPDQGIEQAFDARPPTVVPSVGSGYGSGYSGNGPSSEQDSTFAQDSGASDAQDNIEESQGFE